MAQRITLFLVLTMTLAGCGTGSARSPSATPDPVLTPDTRTRAGPALPFPDNPDPRQCGIPTAWGKDDPAWLSGVYQGTLVQPVVFLYDSHLRREVVGQLAHGSRVRIELFQANPVLDFYRVRSLDADPAQDGWVPAPFVSFEPVAAVPSQ